jgi:hypothetical protein
MASCGRTEQGHLIQQLSLNPIGFAQGEKMIDTWAARCAFRLCIHTMLVADSKFAQLKPHAMVQCTHIT